MEMEKKWFLLSLKSKGTHSIVKDYIADLAYKGKRNFHYVNFSVPMALFNNRPDKKTFLHNYHQFSINAYVVAIY